MPAKKTTNFLITLRPREGINEVEVGMFQTWVGTEASKLLKYAIILEKEGAERHLHCVLVYRNVTDQDNIKSKLYTLLKGLYTSDSRWEIKGVNTDVKAHHDPNGCVGDYFTKEDHVFINCQGFDTSELQQAKLRVSSIKERKKKHVSKKDTLIPLLRKVHEQCKDDMIYEAATATSTPYIQCINKFQVEYCFKELLHQGYHNMLHHWTPTVRRNIIEYWSDLSSNTII